MTDLVRTRDFFSRNAFDTVFNNLLNDVFGPTHFVDTVKKSYYPRIDAKHKDNKLIVEATVPGLTKENVKVDYDEDTELLTIKLEHQSKKENNSEYLWKEIHKSSAVRQMFVSKDDYEIGKVEAEVKNGILTVIIPKRAKVEKNTLKQIEVK